jgi:hypothetical protein
LSASSSGFGVSAGGGAADSLRLDGGSPVVSRLSELTTTKAGKNKTGVIIAYVITIFGESPFLENKIILCLNCWKHFEFKLQVSGEIIF